jgi:hypothetical protein
MITLINTTTDAAVGSVTEAELQFLIDNLEETSPDDTDYYIDQGTIELLSEDGGATDHLLAVLRAALGTSEGVELRWVKKP